MQVRWIAAPPVLLVALALSVTGCGGGGDESTSASSTGVEGGNGSGEPHPESASPTEAEAPSEAESAATGDIPDNQVFLAFADHAAGYSIRYPEGWARRGAGSDVTFQEKGNVIHLVVAKGPAPTPASATRALSGLKQRDPTIKFGSPERLTVGGSPVIKVTYTRMSAPDPVTGKRLPLTVDRYLYARGGKVATLDLGTPVGVDNVDAYRLISRSFRWE